MNLRYLPVWRPAAAAALVLLLPGLGAAQGFKWWQSERFQQELQLTADQITRIEEVFDAYVPEARRQKRVLDRLEDELEALIDTSDEATVMHHADQVEGVRSELSKARTRMLVRIRNVLTADQRVRLAALHEEWERNRKRQDRRQ